MSRRFSETWELSAASKSRFIAKAPMPQTIDAVTAIEQLTEQLRALEGRVAALESKPQTQPEALPTPPLQRPRAPATWRGFPPVATPAGAITVVGKAVLGIAGAYLLRALAESASIPKFAVLTVAILYACFWMVWAVRTQPSNRFASVTYAITSALILSPMLWETTVSFHVLSPSFTAAVIVAFVILTISLGWKRDLQLILWVAMLAAVITTVALIVGTRELAPLTAALLVIGLTTEVSACAGHDLTFRAVPAIAADFAVWLLIFILASEPVPEGYHAVSPATISALSLALLAIYAGAIAYRTVKRKKSITVFEIAQGVAAFALTSFGVLRATHNSAAPALGIVFLLLSGACYWGALSRFVESSYTRNRRVFATWAAALLLAGSYLLLPADLQLTFLAAAAIGTTVLYARTSKLSLGLHGSLYLAAAAAVSPLPTFITGALAETVPSAPGWRLMLVAVAALLCYLLGSHHAEDKPKRRLLWIVPGALVAFAAAALVVFAVVAIATPRFELDASRLSVVRTIVNCALAVTLAFLGSRLRNLELGWLAYAAVAFGTLKLLFEDLRFGNASSLVVSLLFYGLVLILLPKLTRKSRLPAV